MPIEKYITGNEKNPDKKIEEKLKANCLTKAEYIRNFNNLLSGNGAEVKP